MIIFQVVVISLSDDGIVTWDGYRTTLDSPTFVQIISNITQHLTDYPQTNLRHLAEDPWHRRTNLTGLVLRCSTLDVRIVALRRDNTWRVIFHLCITFEFRTFFSIIHT